MTFRSERVALCGVLLAVALGTTHARAQTKDESEPVKRARADFSLATEHVKNARWGEALAAFERSLVQRPHALTIYNIGACERALGRYTRARQSLLRALDADKKSGAAELPKSFADDARQWLTEIESTLVRATVTLKPPTATFLVDGAPLDASTNELIAGLPPGPRAARAPGARFVMVIDPGTHVFSVAQTGFANAVTNKTFVPGDKPILALDLQSLPAFIRVDSNRPGAVVTVDDIDAGIAPVEVTRPAGSYEVAVRKKGYAPYFTTVRVNAGDRPALMAALAEESTPLYKSFWFWAAATTIVAGATVTTYALTRPTPDRPAPDGGGLGWVVSVPAPASR